MGRFRVSHRTEYRYGQTMADGFTTTHLAPRPTAWQSVESVHLHIDPQPDEIEYTLDQFGNAVTQFAVHRPHSSLIIESTIVVSVEPPPIDTATVSWTDIVARAANARGPLATELGPYLAHTTLTPPLVELRELTAPEFVDDRSIADAVSGLCHRIFTGFRFDPGFTDLTTPLATVLAERRGVCQDFAHVAASALRAIGLPARYVSGYIETAPPPGQPKLIGVDASHAWCSVWAGELGWLDFDPTNDQMPPLRHVTVGWGRDYDDVTPVRGVVIGPGRGQSLIVAVDVSSLG
jgi:transglutaminase-like putative cysteine protease